MTDLFRNRGGVGTGNIQKLYNTLLGFMVVVSGTAVNRIIFLTIG